ncbi:glycosyltransferase family 1 protein [Mucor ambiguus]|uniref:sterol 3beta-glucosyltransferase n=1 Tax=Mucor ambiguus TaxID=91626 RepID=A0A0C9M0F7_9FUNG|nr:glycosyltransferase family 1 protein [Mucor ambiguus]
MTENVSQHAALPAPQDTDDDYYDINATEQQDDDDTISEMPALTAATHRPTVGLTRNLSEMSIECSTATDENDDSVLDDELIQADLSNRVLIESKVKKAFALPASETLINVTLPGWMYVTTHHICFYASLPGKKKGPHKAGYLSKKNHVTSPRTYRYYFELRNHVLSWYASAETKYSPLNSVDLKCVIKIEPSKLKRFGIRLTTNTHSHHTIIADSEISQREWLDELRKGVFVAQHAGNSVRIVLPFSKIMTVDKPSVFQFAANIRIKFQEDVAEHAANQGEDYYFAFFPNVEDAYRVITDTWKSSSATNSDTQKRVSVRTIDGSKPPGATGGASFLSFDSFLENISPAALPTMLMGKLMNVTSVFQQPSTENASAENDSLETGQKQQTSSLLSSVKIPYMSSMTKRKEDSAALTTSPNEMTTSSLASRLKRNSLFFNKSNSSTREDAKVIEDSSDASPKASPPSLGNASPDYFRGATAAAADAAADATADKDQQPQYDVQPITINKTRPHSGSYSLAKIPRAVTDAFKHQVLKSDSSSSSVPAIEELPATSSTAEESQSALSIKSNNRSRSTSLSSFKHHISPYYLYNKINGSTSNTSASTLPAPHISNTSLTNPNTDISLLSDADSSSLSTTTTQSRQQQPSVRNRKLRAMSMGSTLISGTWSKLAPGSVDHYFHQQHMNESQHRHPKGPIWLSDKMIDALEEAARVNANHSDSVSTTSSSTSSDREEEEETSFAIDVQVHKFASDPNIRQEEQQTVNEHLNANFPMLLKTEETEAVIKASFWRTIPYSGKIYITDHYFCFNSKILAGQQKLIVPWHDVIQVNKIKTKSYYLLHGMTMVVKDMTDEIYFDFSSVQLRDHCYSICELKADGNLANDSSSVFSKESNTLSLSSLLLDRPEHILHVLNQYVVDGPPLLSTSAKLSQPAESSKRPEKPLHFTCLTIGSRGDVQPYVALCKELQKDGHTCRIATHPEYEQWITQHGIEFRSIGGDPGELMKLCIDNSFLSVSFIREGTKFFYSWFESLLASSYKACQGTDVIIESPSAMVGVHMAERLGVPYFRSMPFPFTRTTKFPHPFASQATAGGRIYNDMTYVMIDMALWAGTSKYVNRFRRDVLELPSTNLDRLELWRVPYIYSFSPSVVHPPKDWPDFIHCTGYWFLDNPDMKWKPDAALVDFLNDTNDTRPIVYIGFGSIIVPDAVETTQIIVEAVLKANVRAIICKGWSARVTTAKVSDRKSRSASDMELIKQEEAEQEQDSEVLLDKYPGTIYHIDSVPHDWLFPQIQGVVHHGGAGTTAAGLRAGLPTVIKPFFGDQRFWGQRIEELQVGICLNKLSKTHLADALKIITQNQTMIVKASKVGETIRKENGPRNAVESIYREFQYAKEQRVVNS